MQCLECGADIGRLDNAHLQACCGLTLHEYALRHRLPLDLLVSTDQINLPERMADYPLPQHYPRERSRGLLYGLRLAGLLRHEAEFTVIPGEIRRLDLLLWDLQYLNDYGFCFRQRYRFDEHSNRVVADNSLKTPSAYLPSSEAASLSPVPPPDFRFALAVCIGHVAELHAGYLFVPLVNRRRAQELVTRLRRERQIDLRMLESVQQGDAVMLRSHTPADTERLFDYLRDLLQEMPGVWQRFHDRTPEVTVVKELVFDSAHFITDHPAKCSNLHGGRYTLQVKVAGRIDPVTACVIDYGYLKRVVTQRVVDRFDHHNLNYVASELAWRSSTEMLCVYIWEQLIDYLPGLVELQLYETQQSWCHYRGPDLAAHQANGGSALLRYFSDLETRRASDADVQEGDAQPLSVVAC